MEKDMNEHEETKVGHLDKDEHKEHRIEYFVNDESQWTEEKELTPIQIMTNAKIDPQTNYLVEIKGTEQISFKDNPNEEIKIHEHMKFVTIYTGPVPVSSNK